MAGIDRGETRFKLLAVATRIEAAVEIVVAEDGEGRGGIADLVVRRTERLETDVILGGGQQRRVAEIRNFPLFAQPRIGAPGEEAGHEDVGGHWLFHVASEEMLDGLQEVALPMDEMQHATNLDLPELFKEGMVHRLLACGILQGPVDLRAAASDLDVGVLAGGDAPIDHRQTVF